MEISDALVAIVFFPSIASIFIFRGPVGRALAERLAGRRLESGRAGAEETGGLDRVLGELEDVRQRLVEMEERQDFAERLLTQHRASPPQPQGGGDA